jgi:GNAT superfamily N-acetyltransferase
MSLAHIELKQLSECPEHVLTVGTWIYEEWWKRPNNTCEVVLKLLGSHTEKDRVPFTVVALAAGQPVGSCCVIENDCVHRPWYAPWVAAVYVKPELRGQGVASALLQEAARIAARVPVKGLYIDCHLKTAPVYEKSGWTILEREVGDKDSVVMFRSSGSEQGAAPNGGPATRPGNLGVTEGPHR